MKELGKIKQEKRLAAEAFHFAFDGGCCWWATFIIVEELGEFTIISDCGNYSHRWSAMGLDGDGLKDFLVGCHAQYVIEKFSYSNKTDLSPEIDYGATRKEWRRAVGKMYGDLYRSPKRYQVRSLTTDLLDEIDRLLEDEPPADLLIERMSPGLYRALGDEPWELIAHNPSPRYEVLQNHLLPFFFNWLREQGYGRKTA